MQLNAPLIPAVPVFDNSAFEFEERQTHNINVIRSDTERQLNNPFPEQKAKKLWEPKRHPTSIRTDNEKLIIFA